MQIMVVYDSQYGNTQQLADAIAAELENWGPVHLTNVRTNPFAVPGKPGLLIVGGPTQGHGVSAPLRAYLEALPAQSLLGVPAAAFDSRARGPRWLTGAASHGIAKRLTRRGAHLVLPPESFLVTGTEGPLLDGERARAQGWARAVGATLAGEPVAARR